MVGFAIDQHNIDSPMLSHRLPNQKSAITSNIMRGVENGERAQVVVVDGAVCGGHVCVSVGGGVDATHSRRAGDHRDPGPRILSSG